MRGFFDDLLAGLFVMAVLAASYIFLFMGTVQSGSMMGVALQHRLKIDKLRSASTAFNHLTEPNTKLPLAELVGKAAQSGSDRIWVGDQAVDVRASCKEALERMVGENYYFIVERPQRTIDLRIIVPQTSTMYDDYLSLLSSIPSLESNLAKQDLNATITLYFLKSKNQCSQWCKDETKQIASCKYLDLPLIGRPEQNWAEAIQQVMKEKATGMLFIVPLVDSLSSGNAADECYSACFVSSKCQFCNATCPVHRSQAIVRRAVVSAQSINAKVCPLLTSPCVEPNKYPTSDILSCEGFSTSFCDLDCPLCQSEGDEVCLGMACWPELVKQVEEISTATGCEYKDFSGQGDLGATLQELITTSVEGSQFIVGIKPPKEKTSYAEDISLPVNPPVKGRLVIW